MGFGSASDILETAPFPPNDAQNSSGSDPSLMASNVFPGQTTSAIVFAWLNSSADDAYSSIANI